MKKYGCLCAGLFLFTALMGCSSNEVDLEALENAETIELTDELVSQVLDPKDPVYLEIWHYYSSSHLRAFDEMVTEFNKTVGNELGIYVEHQSKGTIKDLSEILSYTSMGLVGQGGLPDIFTAYPDTAYDLFLDDDLVDLNKYMSQDDIDKYFESFWNEGVLNGVSTIFPIAKSSEVIMIDRKTYDEYAKNTSDNRELSDVLSTWESIIDVSEDFYNYTDSLTEEENDGMAFIGIDSIDNFVIVNMKQQGIDIMYNDNGEGVLNLDKEALHKLWDIYYIPVVNGWYGIDDTYKTDSIKTGKLAAFIGSTSGGPYFPNVITTEDGKQRDAELEVYPYPYLEGEDKVDIQQGAGMCISKSDVKKEIAAIEFLKWFTDNNLQFSINSAYLPVKEDLIFGSNMDSILDEMEDSGNDSYGNVSKVFKTMIDSLPEYEAYYVDVFANSINTRYELEYLEDFAVESRNNVLAADDYEEAIKEYTNDELFDKWYETFVSNMNETLG